MYLKMDLRQMEQYFNTFCSQNNDPKISFSILPTKRKEYYICSTVNEVKSITLIKRFIYA